MFDTSDLEQHVAVEVPGKWPRFRESEFACRAAREAMADGGLTGDFPRGEVWGGILQPDAIPLSEGERVSGSRAVDIIARENHFFGFRSSIATACSSAGTAIALAGERIAAGLSDLALAGGTAGLFRAVFAGLCRVGAMAPEACRPFDKERDGVILGEGAAFLLLEEEEHARRRGARPYARLLGSGYSCDAKHPIAMDASGAGIERAIAEALKCCGNSPPADLVIAHGTGTRLNDTVELRAIARLYPYGVPVISVKGMMGHTTSASAAISAVLACRMMRDEVRLGNATLREPDKELPSLPLPVKPQSHWDARTIAIHAFGFGGQNVAFQLGKAA